jgi:hypothetical protein
MIQHQAVRMDLPTGLRTGLAQGQQKMLTVLVILEDALTPVASVHHVINRATILHSQLSTHLPTSCQNQKNLSIPHTTILGTDPCMGLHGPDAGIFRVAVLKATIPPLDFVVFAGEAADLKMELVGLHGWDMV